MMAFGTPLDASAFHIVMLAECFLIPAWFLVLALTIMLIRDRFFPHQQDGGEVLRIHGLVFVMAYPTSRAYSVAFVPLNTMCSIMMKLFLALLDGRV